MGHRNRRWVSLTVAVAVAAAVGGVALAVAGASFIPAHFDGADHRLTTHISVVILIFGAVQATCLYASMVALAVESFARRERISALYWPIFAVKTTLMMEALVLAARGVDYLLHGPIAHWRPLYTPGLNLFTSICLLAVFASLTWLHVVLLRGWGWGRHRVLVLVMAMVGTTAAITAAAVLYAQIAR
jgi:hypothetical protein